MSARDRGEASQARDGQGPSSLGPSDWAWEFLRRNPDYRREWRASVPRSLPLVTLRDGTRLLRLRRRYPRAEGWGLLAFADPFKTARTEPVFWLPGLHGRLVRARARSVRDGRAEDSAPLAAFAVDRLATIAADNSVMVLLKGEGSHVALELCDLAVLTQPASLVFELDGLEDLGRKIDCLKTLQRFTRPRPAADHVSPFMNDERLRHALIALDESMAGKTYRQIAITIFGEKRVAEEWVGASQFLKDRTRRLVAKGQELMKGGYRDLLA